MNTPEQSPHEEHPQELVLSGIPQGTVQPARSPQRVVRRKAILSDAPENADLPAPTERSSVTYTVGQQQGGPGANQRRNRNVLKLIAIVVLANNLLIAGAVVWFVYYTFGDLESRLQGPVTATHGALSSTAASTINTEAMEKQNAALETKLNKEITDLHNQLIESRQQTELGSRHQQETEQKLDQLTRRIAGVAAETQDHATAAGATATTPSLDPAGALEAGPSQSDLVILKERNRLTSFADEAIATGAREPYEQLWKALTDPRLSMLVHAARAEILRVQECYLNGQRAKYYGIQQYQIPIAEIFPDAGSLTPAQLSDDQLIQLLEDKKVPWQARVKAAWYLGRHRTTKVGDALVKAVKEDPMLDVEAEATFSFEQVTGYRSKLFEPENLEAWWNTYKSAPPSNGSSKAKGKPAEEKPAKEEAKPSPEKKSAKVDEDKGEPAIEPKIMPPPDKKPLKSEDDKDGKTKAQKKEPEKKPVIPLREPEDKP